MDEKSTADLVRERRKSQGLTQEQLASRADVSIDTIGYFETGRNKTLRLSTLIKIASALKCKTAELIGEG